MERTALSFYLLLVAISAVALFATGMAIAGPTRNTAFGTQALPNASGDFNSAFGFEALQANTTGLENTATGAQALVANTTGPENTATGAGALATNTTGSDNTATGFEALLFNVNGRQNTAAGVFALEQNTSGSDNAATGYEFAPRYLRFVTRRYPAIVNLGRTGLESPPGTASPPTPNVNILAANRPTLKSS
jgi:hypothetical protein